MRTVMVALAVASVMSAGAAQAADRLVSTKGNDQGGANACLALATPCRTLVNALAHASSGDVIKVARGLYTGSLTIRAPGTWTIRGGYGPDFSEATRNVVRNKTTVTGDKGNRFLLIHTLTRSITVALDGLTVSNSRIAPPVGLGANGGGIHAQVLDVSITLSLNEVTMLNNSAEAGGALSLETDYGDIFATITKSVFKNNTARGSGGAIRFHARGVPIRLSIEDSRFENNKGGTGGAVGMRVVGGGRLDIARSIFLRNAAVLATGGAIDVWSDDFILGGSGAGTAVLTMENSVLQDNRAAEIGGAIALRTFVPVHPAPEPLHARVEVDLRNNTIAANRADSGGGLAAIPYEVDFPGASALVTGTLLNNIIRGNTATGLPASGDVLLLPQGDNAAVELDLITNNIGKVANLGAVLTLTPDPQLNVDLMLVRMQGVLQLKATSPMIDAGTCDGAPADDFEGDARPTGTGLCGVDIGADQF